MVQDSEKWYVHQEIGTSTVPDPLFKSCFNIMSEIASSLNE